ncbi:MAG TPA: bifunctional alpha/beta hydrolase/class I SAM-dependent methyltransferase, partial [Gammaproteobacteria bacterium]
MREFEETSFQSHDGTELYYRHWPAVTAAARPRAVIMFHRGHEHSGRLAHLPDELGLEDFAFFAWDARGYGRSPGPRGDSPGYEVSVRDVDCFVRHVAATHGVAMQEIVVLAQSVGAVLVASWVHDYAPPVRCLVLAAPAFKVRLYVPFALAGLRLMMRLRGNFSVNSYVKAQFLTHDPERILSYRRDPLIVRPISVRMLVALFDAGKRVVADAGAIQLPVLLLSSGADWVVYKGPQRRFFLGLGGQRNEFHELPGFFHDTLGEKNRAVALERVRAFVLRMFERPPPAPQLLDADRRGYTFEEEARLRQPLPAWSPKGLGYAVQRFLLRTLGRRSAGVRLGLETGFDSGSTLDYVYRNEARGDGTLGRLLDRAYLDAIG